MGSRPGAARGTRVARSPFPQTDPHIWRYISPSLLPLVIPPEALPVLQGLLPFTGETDGKILDCAKRRNPYFQLKGDRLRGRCRREYSIGHRLAGEADLGAQQIGLAVGDVAVRQADAEDPRPLPRTGREGVLEMLQHGGAEAAREDVLLDRHQQVVVARQVRSQLPVERLGEA